MIQEEEEEEPLEEATAATAAATAAASMPLLSWAAVYLLTGACAPALIDFLRLSGATRDVPPTLLPMLSNTLGMTLVGLLLASSTSGGWLQCRSLARLLGLLTATLSPTAQDKGAAILEERSSVALTKATILDFMSNVFVTAGLLWTGSGTFSVIYSSGVAWTAILCHFLGQKLNLQQQFGICIVTLGLILNGAGNFLIVESAVAVNDVDGEGRVPTVISGEDSGSNYKTFFLGCILVLVGTILHSGMFVFCEAQLRFHTVDRYELCGTMGSNEAGALIFWNMLLTSIWGGPYEMYIRPIEERGSTTPEFALFLFTCLIFCNALHAVAFFSMIDKVGAISMGILKGVLSVSVFAIASLLYCDVESAQCVTLVKSFSVFMVVGGSLVYSVSTQPANMPLSPRQMAKPQIV